jgi:hypothetical protein
MICSHCNNLRNKFFIDFICLSDNDNDDQSNLLNNSMSKYTGDVVPSKTNTCVNGLSAFL